MAKECTGNGVYGEFTVGISEGDEYMGFWYTSPNGVQFISIPESDIVVTMSVLKAFVDSYYEEKKY